MIQQYAIYDDFLADPASMVATLRTQKYFVQGRDKTSKRVKNNIPLDITYSDSPILGDPRINSPKWVGYRSRDVQAIDMNIHDLIIGQLLDKIISGFSVQKIEFEVESYFHILTSEFTPTEKWFHQDSNCFFAGVLYLAENPPPNSGTTLHINGAKVSVENKFNRLVIYNSNLNHGVEGCFGDSIENARCTYVFFFKDISFYSTIPNLGGQ